MNLKKDPCFLHVIHCYGDYNILLRNEALIAEKGEKKMKGYMDIQKKGSPPNTEASYKNDLQPSKIVTSKAQIVYSIDPDK